MESPIPRPFVQTFRKHFEIFPGTPDGNKNPHAKALRRELKVSREQSILRGPTSSRLRVRHRSSVAPNSV